MRLRATAAVSYALILGTMEYGHSFDINASGLLGDVWYGSVLGLLIWILGVPVGFLVGRWWVLLTALAPLAVDLYLQAIGHTVPWHDSDPFQPGLAFFGIGFAAVPLLVGLAARAGWDGRRGRRPA